MLLQIYTGSMHTNTGAGMHCMKLTVGSILHVHACFKVLSTLHMIQLGNDTNANMSEILHPAMLLYDKATVEQIEKVPFVQLILHQRPQKLTRL